MVRRGLVVLLLVTATACGSEGGDTDGATAAPTTIALTTTVETTTTAATTTTVPSTTTTTTTLAPTTTVDPLDVLAAEIERDLNLGEQALLASVAEPANDELRLALEKHYSGTSLQLALETLDVLVADGLRGRPNPDVPSLVRVISILEPSDDPVSQPILVELCRIDSGVIFEPTADGGEIVVNDRIRVARTSSRVRLRNDTWVLDGGELIEELGVEGCD